MKMFPNPFSLMINDNGSPLIYEERPKEDISYIILGLIGSIANSLILAAILTHRALRRHKEYTLLGFLVLFNALMSFGFLTAGVYRMIVGSQVDQLVSQISCLKLPHCILFAGVPCVGSILLPFIAIDRLIAISRPLQYRVREAYKGYYAKIVGGFSICFYMFCFGYAAADAAFGDRKISSRCDTREVFSQGYKLFESLCIVISHLLAVAIFTIVIAHFHCYAKQRPLRRESKSGLAALRQQTRVMRTFSIFSAMTLFLVVLPFMGIFIMTMLTPTHQKYKDILDTAYLITVKIAVMNPTLNVVVYALRHNEIYVGVRSLLVRQPMPDSTEQWCLSRGSTARPSLGRSLSCPDTPPRFKYSLAHYRMVQDSQQKREVAPLSTSDPERCTQIT